MKSERQHGHKSSRARQYVSFFILALFLGLFVSAMAKPRADLALVSLMFPEKVEFQSRLNRANNELFLSFPHTSEASLKKYLQPVALTSGTTLAAVRTQAEGGDSSILRIKLAHKNLCVRVLESKPFGIVISVTRKPTDAEKEHLRKKAVFYTSASLYRA